MKFTGVQMLRFAAALLVAVMHITQALSVHLTGQGDSHYWGQGSAGVDIFFVISGFVMGLTAPPAAPQLAARAAQAGQFLLRRLIRVVPLYWFYTLLKVALLAAVPAVATRFTLDGEHLLASLFFVPWVSPWGAVQPVLPVGWTLNFEVLFYALFALAMLLGLPRLLCCLGVFGLLIWAAPHAVDMVALRFYGSSIVLEFVLGVGLARLHQRGPVIPPEAGLLALCLGLLLMFGLPWRAEDDRFISWGIPAGLIVAGALWLEPWVGALKGTRTLAFLGDASYSIYLSHTFVVPAVVQAAVALQLTHSWTVGLLATLSVVVAGSLSYVMLERPMTLGLQRRLMGQRPGAPSPLMHTDTKAPTATTHAP